MADSLHACGRGPGLPARRREVFSGLGFRAVVRRGAGGDRPQRRRQILAAAHDRGPAADRRRRALARGRRRRTAASANRRIISAIRTRSNPRSRCSRISTSGVAWLGGGGMPRDGACAQSVSTRSPTCRPLIFRPGRNAGCRSRGSSRSRARSGCSTSRPPRSTRAAQTALLVSDARASRQRRHDRRRDACADSAIDGMRELRIGAPA